MWYRKKRDKSGIACCEDEVCRQPADLKFKLRCYCPACNKKAETLEKVIRWYSTAFSKVPYIYPPS